MLYIFTGIFFAGLCMLSWIDIKSYLLPNALNYTLLGIGLLQAHVLGRNFGFNLLGAMLGYSIFVGVELAFKAIRGKDGLGRGDAKLLAVGGAWCGMFALPLIVAIASLSGIMAILYLQKGAKGRIPFGPFLSVSMFAIWVLQEIYLPFYTAG